MPSSPSWHAETVRRNFGIVTAAFLAPLLVFSLLRVATSSLRERAYELSGQVVNAMLGEDQSSRDLAQEILLSGELSSIRQTLTWSEGGAIVFCILMPMLLFRPVSHRAIANVLTAAILGILGTRVFTGYPDLDLYSLIAFLFAASMMAMMVGLYRNYRLRQATEGV